MKKTKIILDILMMITMILLVVIYFTGTKKHEVIGIVFILEFTLHKILNIKSIIALLKQLWKRVCKGKAKTLIITDIVLTITIILSSISGIVISKHLFEINTNYGEYWYIVHLITSYLGVLIVLYHTFLHRKQIISAINKMLNITTKKIQEYIFNVFLIICLILLINIFIKNETIKKIKTIYLLGKSKTEIKVEIKEKEDETGIIVEKEGPTASEITKYLGGLRCDGCKKRCLLTMPMCIIGQQKAEQETIKYIENYTESN